MSDLIDRQALLKQIDIDSDGEPGYYGDTWKFIDTIKNMPNEHDLPKDTDTISRQAAITQLSHNKNKGDDEWELAVENDIRTIWKLPTAEPKRGKWIDKGITGDWQYLTDGRGRSWHKWQCDQCKDMVNKRSFYCPNCGADMRGEKDGCDS